jgi:nucleoside-diphosphate-sugar epimerase
VRAPALLLELGGLRHGARGAAAEDCEFRPQTIYGASKLAGEYYAQVFHRSGWLETVVARPHNTYGPREHYAADRGELIPRLIVRGLAGLPPVLYGDGSQTRDFTYVEETRAVPGGADDHPGGGGRNLQYLPRRERSRSATSRSRWQSWSV